MKHKTWMIPMILIGNLLALSALFLSLYSFIAKPAFLSVFPDASGAPLAFLLIGLTLLIAANRPWGRIIQKDTMPKEKRIERNDERNIQLEEKSSNLAFQFLSLAILFSIAILSLLGYLNEVAFLMLYALTIGSFLIKNLAKKYYAKQL